MHFNQHYSKLLFAAAIAMPFTAQASPKYLYKAIALLPFTPGQGSGVASMINNAGMICGSEGRAGFCYDAGTVTELAPLPGDDVSSVQAINDKGQVVGFSQASFNRHPVLFVDGMATELPIGHAIGSANGINKAGHVVGYFVDGANQSVAYLYKNGAIVDLGSLGPIRSGIATAINAHKQIVGSSAAADNPDFPFQTDLHAFLWENGVMKDLGTLGGRESNAQAINDRGQVVGISAVSMSGQSEQHAFLWENGVMKDLGAGLDGRSDARSINNRGQVVGAADALAGGFLYEPGKGVRALNDLVNPADGLNIVYPQSINDRREIVGYGCKGALCGPILLVRVSDDKETGAGTDAAEEGTAPEPGR